MSSTPCDVLVVGAGAAGLTAALTCAERGASVLMLTKGHAPDSSSWHAQGGIATALGDDDTTALHAIDTELAGRDLCRTSAVRVLTEEGPERVRELIKIGVPLDPDLSMEGGHSRRRVSSVEGAATGWAVTSVLGRRAARTEGIAIREAAHVLALWLADGRCLGVLTPDGPIAARATVLAMGGAAALWARTTNPEGQIGDAIAIAVRAGTTVADLEFMQFHPTVLAGSRLLLTEALRGEGATLLDETGERFVDELAPRDVVARAIVAKGRAFLDLREIDRSRFPASWSRSRRPASIPRASRSPSRRPPTTRSAASSRIWRGGRIWRAYSPPASVPPRAFTAPIASPPTPCWSAWSSDGAPPWPPSTNPPCPRCRVPPRSRPQHVSPPRSCANKSGSTPA